MTQKLDRDGNRITILFADRSKKSARAEKLLKAHGIHYQREPAPKTYNPPSLVTTEGTFDGLTAIKWWLRMIEAHQRQ
jgi:hypothetical protein